MRIVCRLASRTIGKTSKPARASALLTISASLYGLSKRDNTCPEYAPLAMISAMRVSAAAAIGAKPQTTSVSRKTNRGADRSRMVPPSPEIKFARTGPPQQQPLLAGMRVSGRAATPLSPSTDPISSKAKPSSGHIMSETFTGWVFAACIGVAAMCGGDHAVLAQAGSTGGIIGKQDKAVSGGEERHGSSRPAS